METIRPLTAEDHAAWLRMREQLWPDASPAQRSEEADAIRADTDQAVLVADSGGGVLSGFVELSLHPHAIGCTTRPIGYIEGWYVAPGARRRGLGRALLAAAEVWAMGKGCQEMASDAVLGNELSIAAHQAAGYELVERLVHLRKRIG